MICLQGQNSEIETSIIYHWALQNSMRTWVAAVVLVPFMGSICHSNSQHIHGEQIHVLFSPIAKNSESDPWYHLIERYFVVKKWSKVPGFHTLLHANSYSECCQLICSNNDDDDATYFNTPFNRFAACKSLSSFRLLSKTDFNSFTSDIGFETFYNDEISDDYNTMLCSWGKALVIWNQNHLWLMYQLFLVRQNYTDISNLNV